MSAKSHRRSIQGKISILMVSAVVLCSVFIGGVGIISAQNTIKSTTDRYIYARVDAECSSLNEILTPVSQSVGILAQSITDDLENEDLSEDGLLDAYLEEKEADIVTDARATDGAIAVYVRFDPDLAGPTSGLFLQRKSLDSDFEELAVTDLSTVEENSEDAVWYYEPMKSGEPIWLTPYYNSSLETYIISYVIPLYKDGSFFGVAGMDIPMEYLSDTVGEISLYDSGYAYLASEDGTIYWHPSQEVGTKVEGNKKIYSVRQKTENGMYLVLAAPKSEIYYERNILILQVLLFTLAMIIIFSILTIVVCRSMVRPLRSLNEAAKTMADGDNYVEVKVRSNDEIGELAESFNKTALHLCEYSNYIKGLAYKDGLTSVRNRTAFDQTCAELTAEFLAHPDMNFGVVVMDVNGLKQVNDGKGHEAGDELIVSACRLICRTYAHSPVFRIGGDEFVAILKGEDYDNRVNLLRHLRREMKDPEKAQTPYGQLSVASGMAIYNRESDSSVDDVFRRADAAMYQNKKKMKSAPEGEN